MKTFFYFSLLLWVGVGGCKKDAYHHFEGTYHMVGYSQFWHMGDTTNYPAIIIDTIIPVSKVDNVTLSFMGKNLVYDSSNSNATNSYRFQLGIGSNYAQLTFHKPFTDDSVFYGSASGGLGGGVNTNLRGIKIH